MLFERVTAIRLPDIAALDPMAYGRADVMVAGALILERVTGCRPGRERLRDAVAVSTVWALTRPRPSWVQSVDISEAGCPGCRGDRIGDSGHVLELPLHGIPGRGVTLCIRRLLWCGTAIVGNPTESQGSNEGIARCKYSLNRGTVKPCRHELGYRSSPW